MEGPDFANVKVGLNDSVVTQYLIFHRYAIKTYGENAVVIMKLGDFYEAFFAENEGPDVDLMGSKLQYTVYDKYGGRGIGFPVIMLDVCVQILQTIYSHIVRVDEIDKENSKKNKTKQVRRIVRIYTNGTFTQENEYNEKSKAKLGSLGTNLSNKAAIFPLITNIFFHAIGKSKLTHQPLVIASIASISIDDGNTHILELHSRSDNPDFVIDEIASYFTRHKPKLLQITLRCDDKTQIVDIRHLIHRIKQFSNVESKDIVSSEEIASEYFKIDYQRQFLAKIYKSCGSLSPIQFIGLERNQQSIVSFIQLLQSIYEKYPPLIESISKPVILNSGDIVELSTDAINQLSLYQDLNQEKSVYDIINHTKTPMGSRQLLSRLIYPSYNIEMLQKRYQLIEHFQSISEVDANQPFWKIILSLLADFTDIDKTHRKFILETILPSNLYTLVREYKSVRTIMRYCVAQDHSEMIFSKSDRKNLIELLKKLEILDLSVCKNVYNIDLTTFNIFKYGIFPDIDDMCEILHHIDKVKNEIVKELNSLLVGKENAFTWIINDTTEQLLIDVTRVRYKSITQILAQKSTVITINGESYPLASLTPRDIFKSRVALSNDQIVELSSKYFDTIKKIRNTMREHFLSLVQNINETYYNFMNEISRKIGEIDVTCSLASVAHLYNYCKPEIVDEENSFVNFTDLRHAIVERELAESGYCKENYTPHSFCLGKTVDEHDSASLLVLYGSNMCGKSTLLRGVGIAVVLAQIGSYVPASRFILSPFYSIYARILTIDNLHRSRSSFQQEMLELRPILGRTDSNSLVLADEPCHSTDHIDACSIVLPTLEELGRRNCCGIITTHLHELSDDTELIAIPGLRIYHLSVEIQPKARDGNMKVVYTRQLKAGPGLRCYGIEVASEANISPDVIKRAYQVRRRLLKLSDQFLTYKTSNYSSRIYMDKCEICGRPATETHHELHQAEADQRGFVGFVPIHSATNLRLLCDKCHKKTHTSVKT